MSDVALLGIRVDSSQSEKAARELDALALSAGRADVAADRLSTTSGRKMAPAMSAGSQQSRMLAMQLSRVAQQASATGDGNQALAIQLPDMALGFGTVGIAAGVLASVALPALVSILGSAWAEVESFDDAMEGLTATQDGLKSSTEILSMTIPELYEQFGNYAFAVRDATLALIEYQAVEAKIKLGETLIEASAAVDRYADALGRGAQVMANELDILPGKVAPVQEAFQKLRDAASFEDRLAALRGVEQALAGAGVSAEKLPPALRQALMEGHQAAITMAELAKTTEDAEAAADRLSGAGPGAGWLGTAIAEAGTLATALWDAYAAKAALGGMNNGVEGGRGADPRGFVTDPYWKDKYFPDPEKMNTAKSGGGGGGSGPYATDLQALIENLRSKREIEDEWYQENLAILQDQRSVEIMGKQAHDQAMIDLHEEYQRRIAEIDADAQQQRLSDTANLFGALAGVAQAGGQRMAKVAATFGAIEATVNAYKAAVAALAAPNLTVAQRFTAYASVLAAGLKGVAAIRAAGGIGGGGGGGASVAAQGATGGGGQTIEYKVYGLDRDAIYSGAFIEKIFSGLMEEGKKRGLNNQSVVFM